MNQSLGTDDDSWVKENPVYCPISWCNAHNHRFLRCGDADGDYDGIHVGRVRYVKRFEKTTGRKIISYQEAGVENPELMVGYGQMLQDMIDNGSVPGRKGPARRGRR